MDFFELWRLVAYVIALLFSLMMAVQMIRLRHPLAYVLAVLMLFWAVNVVMLGVLLGMDVAGWPIADRTPLVTVNSTLLAVGPVLLFVWFMFQNGWGRRHG